MSQIGSTKEVLHEARAKLFERLANFCTPDHILRLLRERPAGVVSSNKQVSDDVVLWISMPFHAVWYHVKLEKLLNNMCSNYEFELAWREAYGRNAPPVRIRVAWSNRLPAACHVLAMGRR